MSEPADTQRVTRAQLSWVGSLSIAVAVVLLDQATKWCAEHFLTRNDPIPVVGELLRWHLLYNPGAAFSMGTSSTWIFTIISSIAVVVLVWVLRTPRPRAMQLAFVLLLGGAAGNLIDRLLRAPGFGVGHVVDFIALPNFPVFNVADMCITCAGVLLVLISLRPTWFGIETEER